MKISHMDKFVSGVKVSLWLIYLHTNFYWLLGKLQMILRNWILFCLICAVISFSDPMVD